jgi:hypothetical protein
MSPETITAAKDLLTLLALLGAVIQAIRGARRSKTLTDDIETGARVGTLVEGDKKEHHDQKKRDGLLGRMGKVEAKVAEHEAVAARAEAGERLAREANTRLDALMKTLEAEHTKLANAWAAHESHHDTLEERKAQFVEALIKREKLVWRRIRAILRGMNVPSDISDDLRLEEVIKERFSGSGVSVDHVAARQALLAEQTGRFNTIPRPTSESPPPLLPPRRGPKQSQPLGGKSSQPLGGKSSQPLGGKSSQPFGGHGRVDPRRDEDDGD